MTVCIWINSRRPVKYKARKMCERLQLCFGVASISRDLFLSLHFLCSSSFGWRSPLCTVCCISFERWFWKISSAKPIFSCLVNSYLAKCVATQYLINVTFCDILRNTRQRSFQFTAQNDTPRMRIEQKSHRRPRFNCKYGYKCASLRVLIVEPKMGIVQLMKHFKWMGWVWKDLFCVLPLLTWYMVFDAKTGFTLWVVRLEFGRWSRFLVQISCPCCNNRSKHQGIPMCKAENSANFENYLERFKIISNKSFLCDILCASNAINLQSEQQSKRETERHKQMDIQNVHSKNVRRMLCHECFVLIFIQISNCATGVDYSSINVNAINYHIFGQT